MVARLAGAVFALALCADVVAIWTGAGVAFIVVAVMFAVCVTVMQVINVVQVHYCFMAAVRTVRV